MRYIYAKKGVCECKWLTPTLDHRMLEKLCFKNIGPLIWKKLINIGPQNSARVTLRQQMKKKKGTKKEMNKAQSGYGHAKPK